MMYAVTVDSLSELWSIVSDQKKIKKADEILINREIIVGGSGQIKLLIEARDGQESWSLSSPIPSPEERCRLCDRPWTIRNLRDVVSKSRDYDRVLAHKSCAKIEMVHKERTEFLASFEKAGFGPITLSEIDNGYWPEAYKDEYFYTPWYLVETLKGTIKIGHRKRVVHIEVVLPGHSSRDFDLAEAFLKEDVTKGWNYIHAWDSSKVTEYLTVINESMSCLFQ